MNHSNDHSLLKAQNPYSGELSVPKGRFLLVRLWELKPGDRARLVDFGATPSHYRRRLLSLGMTRGVLFLVVRFAPLGCPVHIEVRGTALALRQEEASQLLLERL